MKNDSILLILGYSLISGVVLLSFYMGEIIEPKVDIVVVKTLKKVVRS